MGNSEFPVKISIVVPVYRVENFLPRCLESCISQTFEDIEIICVDDGSPDGCGKIADIYAAADSRVRVIHKENGGVSSARNAGIDAARGKYVMFADGDDYLRENACEAVWKEAEKNGSEIIVYGGDAVPEYPAATDWIYDTLNVRNVHYDSFVPAALFLENGAEPFIWLQAYSTDLLNRTGVRFNEAISLGEDLMFQYMIFPFAEGISFMAEKLYVYRWYRKGSYMNLNGQDYDKKIAKHIQNVEIITRYWEDRGLADKYPRDFYSWAVRFVVNDLMDYEFSDRGALARSFCEYAEKSGLMRHKNKLSLAAKIKLSKVRKMAKK